MDDKSQIEAKFQIMLIALNCAKSGTIQLQLVIHWTFNALLRYGTLQVSFCAKPHHLKQPKCVRSSSLLQWLFLSSMIHFDSNLFLKHSSVYYYSKGGIWEVWPFIFVCLAASLETGSLDFIPSCAALHGKHTSE